MKIEGHNYYKQVCLYLICTASKLEPHNIILVTLIHKYKLIGASLSEPHIEGTALREWDNMYVLYGTTVIFRIYALLFQ